MNIMGFFQYRFAELIKRFELLQIVSRNVSFYSSRNATMEKWR
jgi:hypothetical protein